MLLQYGGIPLPSTSYPSYVIFVEYAKNKYAHQVCKWQKATKLQKKVAHEICLTLSNLAWFLVKLEGSVRDSRRRFLRQNKTTKEMSTERRGVTFAASYTYALRFQLTGPSPLT